MLFSGCSMSNTAKGGLIGGGGGGALGALIGQLAGGGKGAAIGAAIGTTLGAGAGVIIGNKMDKAKKAAEAANAQAELLTDNEGYTYVKVTFPSGILFSTGNYSLSNGARNDLATFATGLDADMDIYIWLYRQSGLEEQHGRAEQSQEPDAVSAARAVCEQLSAFLRPEFSSDSQGYGYGREQSCSRQYFCSRP